MAKPPFYYSEGPYLRSLQSLHYALVKNESFIQFMGAPRSGKTALCDKLALYMERKGHEVHFIDRPLDSPEMVRSVLAHKFNLPSSNNFARLLEDSLAQSEEKTRVLIFDDAQLLSDITLIEIHRLSEIQVNSKRLLNIVLCGDPQLEKRLISKAAFKSLALNVSHKFLLEPMRQEEVGQFVASYLAHEDLPDIPISTAALGLIARTTQGFPGPATLVAQIIADSRRGASVTSELGKEELARLIKASNIRAALPTSQIFEPGQLKIIAPIAAVFAIAVLGFLFQLMMDRSAAPAEDSAVAEINDAPEVMVEPGDSPFVTTDPATADVVSEGALSEVEAADSELPANTSTASIASAEPTPVPSMPSLLRPAPSFSLEEDEVEEPVSDSNLSLVTAAEIGVTGELLEIPEFAELLALEAEQASDAAEVPQSAGETNKPNSMSVPVQSGDGNDTSIGLEVASTVTAAQPEMEEAIETEDADSETIEPLLTAQPATASQNIPSSETETETAPDIAADESYRESIDAWLTAWAEQDMDGYFGSYAENFEPRYDNSVRAWRRNRTRVITNAGSITLELTELNVVAEDADEIEVNFWLDYESPTYSDSTLKKLVLANTAGRWLIVEEVNLQVRP